MCHYFQKMLSSWWQCLYTFHFRVSWGNFVLLLQRLAKLILRSSFTKFVSFKSLQTCSLLKITDLSFLLVKFGNILQIYFEHSTFLSRALRNCWITPSLMRKGGKRILFLSTKCIYNIFEALHKAIFVWGGQPFLTQWFTRSVLSTCKKDMGYLVYPDCCLKKKFTIFKSTHMTNLWS